MMELFSYNIQRGDVFLINGEKWFINHISEYSGDYYCYPYFESKRNILCAVFDKEDVEYGTYLFNHFKENSTAYSNI